MSFPKQIDDGDWKVAKQTGPVEYSWPFADKGDNRSFIAKVRMKQDANFYTRITQPMVRRAFPPGYAYMVQATDASDAVNGIVEWQEIFASVPQTRTEPSSVSYTQKFINTERDTGTGVTSFTVGSYTQTRAAEILYEYFTSIPETILAPDLIQTGRNIWQISGWGTFSPGQQILAQDTTTRIYMGRIYERQSIFIRYAAIVAHASAA